MSTPEAALSEHEARTLARKIVERIHAHGQGVDRLGVHLDQSGFWFTAWMNGRFVTVRTPEGRFRYDDVAKELIALSQESVIVSRRIVEVTPPPAETNLLPGA